MKRQRLSRQAVTEAKVWACLVDLALEGGLLGAAMVLRNWDCREATDQCQESHWTKEALDRDRKTETALCLERWVQRNFHRHGSQPGPLFSVSSRCGQVVHRQGCA